MLVYERWNIPRCAFLGYQRCFDELNGKPSFQVPFNMTCATKTSAVTVDTLHDAILTVEHPGSWIVCNDS